MALGFVFIRVHLVSDVKIMIISAIHGTTLHGRYHDTIIGLNLSLQIYEYMKCMSFCTKNTAIELVAHILLNWW